MAAVTSNFQEGVSPPPPSYIHGCGYIRQNQATTNQDNDPDDELLVGYTNDNTEFRGTLEFDLSDIYAGDQIDAASLVLHTGGGLSASITINVYQYDYEFDETSSTWNLPNTGDATAGGTKGSLLSTLVFNPSIPSGPGTLITLPSPAAFRSSIASALAGDGFLRHFVASSSPLATRPSRPLPIARG